MTQRKKQRYNLRYKAQHKGANNEKKGCKTMNNPTKPKFKKGDRVTYEGLGPDATATVDAVHFVRGRAEPEYTLKIERGADCATRWRLEGTLTRSPKARKPRRATKPSFKYRYE